MELKTENFKIETNKIGQVASINFKGTELLHEGKQWWMKTFPIIWPVVGISQAWEYKGKNYEIPKHGFMKDLEWDGYVVDNTITLISTFIANDVYPFSIDIAINISVKDNKVIIETSFSNLSKEEAYFQFGYHPAFKIDPSTTIKGPDINAIDLDGKFLNKIYKQEKLIDMAFGSEYDTLVNKNIDFDSVEYNYNDLTIKVGFDSPNVQFWKPAEALFVCIEPWWGANDPEKALVKEAKDKDGVIKLATGETWKATMSIEVK